MIFVTKSGKEIQVPNDYTFMSLEKFTQEVYQQGREEAIDEYNNKLIARLIPNIDRIPSAKYSETYLAITEISEQLKEK